jgi:hypothetical protein
LLLREKLSEQHRVHDLKKLDKEAVNKFRLETVHFFGDNPSALSDKELDRIANEMEKSTDGTQCVQNLDQQQELMNKCLKLLLKNRFSTLLSLQSHLQISNAMVCILDCASFEFLSKTFYFSLKINIVTGNITIELRKP